MKRFLFASLALVCAASFAQADQGNPKLKSIEAIRFGPNGLLIIGSGSDVVTVETGDTKETAWKNTEIAGIDGILAAKAGFKVTDFDITRISVNPASKKLYVAVRSKSNQYAILTIDGDGKIAEFSLEDVKYNRYPLVVKEKAVTKITDVIWAGGRIVAATQATDTFASRVFTIFPGKTASSSFYTETFHTGHNKIETNAPIRCLMAYEENSKANIVGSFTCTPIVKYPLDDAQPDVKVKGTTVLELGQGSTPRSMFTYEKDGKKYILVNANRNDKKPTEKLNFPSGYWVAKVDHTLLKETVNVNEKAPFRVGKGSVTVADRVSVAKEYFGTHHMDQLDAARAIVVLDVKGKGHDLRVLPLP